MGWFEWFCVNVLFIGLVTFLLVRYFSNSIASMKQLGVPYTTDPSIIWNFVFGKENLASAMNRMYKKFPNERFFGGFTFSTTPTVYVKDSELLERIIIKDFTNFHDRNPDYFAEFEYTDHHLGNVNGLSWKNLRNKLTPTFTSGKLKGMMEQFLICSDSLEKFIESNALNKSVDVTEIIQRFTIDVIASCAFGLDTQTLHDENSLFKKYSSRPFRPSLLPRILLAAVPLHGLMMKLNKLRRNEVTAFFIDTVVNTVNYRQINNVNRNDYLNLLMELHQTDMKLVAEGKVDPDEPGLIDQRSLVSNSFVFLVAGFETTALTLSYLLYELCLNSDIQEKTYREILDVLKTFESKISYGAIKEMKYLRQVIDETLRKHPPIGFTTRITKAPFPIPDTNAVLPKGTAVTIPIYGLHHDPTHYPEPDKFIPERFSEENVHKIKKMTYLPFGGGPRICLGSRFAILEMSVAVCQILTKYKLVRCDKTTDNFEFSNESFTAAPKNGLWIKLEKRLHS